MAGFAALYPPYEPKFVRIHQGLCGKIDFEIGPINRGELIITL